MSKPINIRHRISTFYKTIHPDTTYNFPEIAKNINSKSLCELNSYIDIFKHGFKCGFVSKKLNFFKPYLTSNGKLLNNRIQPISITLPGIPPEPNGFDLQTAQEKLVNNINIALNEKSGIFKPLDQSIELVESQNDSRDKISNLIDMEMMNEAMFANITQYKLFDEIKGIYKGIRRIRGRSLMLKRVKHEIRRRIIELMDGESDFLSAGMNLNYLFLKNKLSKIEVEMAMNGISGKNLSDSDLWLLKGVWRVLHNSKPQIPVLIDTINSDYTFNKKYGYIQLPCNFEVMKLVEFLEINLDKITLVRSNLRL